MANSLYPTTTSQVALVAPAANTLYEAQVAMVAGIYNYQSTGAYSVDLWYQNSYVTSFTLGASGGSFSVSSPVDRIWFYQTTGANQGATISLVTTVSTLLTGTAQTITTSQTYNGNGFAYAVLLSGGGGGAGGTQRVAGGTYVGWNSDGAPGGAGGSGQVTSGHTTLSSNMSVLVGAGGTGGTFGNVGSDGGTTTFGSLTIGSAGSGGVFPTGGTGAAVGATPAVSSGSSINYVGCSNYSNASWWAAANAANTAAVTSSIPYTLIASGTIGGGSAGGFYINAYRYGSSPSYYAGGGGGQGTLGQGGAGAGSNFGCGYTNLNQYTPVSYPAGNATGVASGGGGASYGNGGNGSSGAIYLVKYA